MPQQRRSSRALAQQPSNASQNTVDSSSSSTASARAERHTRSHTKASTPQKAATPRSRTSEELSTAPAQARPDQGQGRRPKRKRGGAGEDDPGPDLSVEPVKGDVEAEVDAVEDEADEEDEEVTRCICTQLEYPGPPFPVVLNPRERGAKDEAALQSPIEPADAPTDEPGSLFIQCDTCKVWQHGGCVGIMDVSMSPDEYFCELCRGDLHSMVSGPKGQRSSRYLPVLGPTSSKPSPSASIPKETKSTRGRSGGQMSTPLSSKRRSTMNSRDAAYDEEEQLRRAIEESKAQKMAGNVAGSDRDPKRARSDSQDVPIGSLKRRRTNSHSAGAGSPTHPTPPDQAHLDEESPSNKASAGTAPKRGRAAARKQQEKELRDEAAQRTRGRAEAAEKRKGRADRRRAEDSEAPSERPASRTGGAMSPPASIPRPAEGRVTARAGKNTATNGQAASNTATASRKPVRAPAKRNRQGRNQYTRERDRARDIASGLREPSNARSQSRDGPARDDGRNGHAATFAYAGLNGDSGKPSRPRYMNPNRTTMNDMKRRVAAILEFISRVQVEMAGEKTLPAAGAGGVAVGSSTAMASIAAAAAATATIVKSLGGNDIPKITLTSRNDNGGGGKPPTTSSSASTTATDMVNGNGAGNAVQPATMGAAAKTDASDVLERAFTDLNSLEMMDVLTRQLVLWQKDFGKYGDK